MKILDARIIGRVARALPRQIFSLERLFLCDSFLKVLHKARGQILAEHIYAPIILVNVRR